MSDVSQVSPSYSCNVEAQIEQKRLGRRRKVFHGGTLCSGCYNEPPMPGQRYGANCHSQYEADRRRREREELNRLRAAARTRAEVTP